MITYSVGKVGNDPKPITAIATIMGLNFEKTTAENKLKLTTGAKERYLAAGFFLGADRQKYGWLIENTANNFQQGSNTFEKINAVHKTVL